MTPLPSAASAAAVHTTNKGLPKDTGMLLVTNGFRREERFIKRRDGFKKYASLVWW